MSQASGVTGGPTKFISRFAGCAGGLKDVGARGAGGVAASAEDHVVLDAPVEHAACVLGCDEKVDRIGGVRVSEGVVRFYEPLKLGACATHFLCGLIEGHIELVELIGARQP